MKVREKGR